MASKRNNQTNFMNSSNIATRQIIAESIKVKQAILDDEAMTSQIGSIAGLCISALADGHKILLCGNGGSASDAQHIAAELSGRFYRDRSPLDAEALHVNTSYLTAVANDYSYNDVYSRLLLAKGRAGDVLIALSTSGNSENILKAVEEANRIPMVTIGMTGADGGKLKNLCKTTIRVPSADTARIQESHIMIGHILCYLIEESLFNK
jgi:D-sedoheptulose 7-phosphate isomerase